MLKYVVCIYRYRFLKLAFCNEYKNKASTSNNKVSKVTLKSPTKFSYIESFY